MGKIVHFEIPADDIEKMINFYEKAFEWKIEKAENINYWLIDTGEGEGISGGILQKQKPLQRVMNTIIVKSVDKTVEKIVENKGKILSDKIVIQGIGYIVYFRDVEGNIFSIMEPSPEAKML